MQLKGTQLNGTGVIRHLLLVLSWTPSGSYGGRSPECDLHHALEAFVVKRALLPRIGAQLGKLVRRNAGIQPRLIVLGTFGRVAAEGQVERVGRDQGVGRGKRPPTSPCPG